MKIERTKNAIRNIIFGIILRIYQLLVPFLMRTAMIYFMGVRYLGLSGLFTSILSVLNLAELGVGSAMIFSMYKPIVDDDTKKICALMRLYKIYYRMIGLSIAAVGVILTPFIPRLISGDVPNDINIYILYLLNLSATVLSYWLFAYKNSILHAFQRTDIVSKVSIVTSSIQYFLQLAVLIFWRDYYLYVIVAFLSQALTNVLTAYHANKLYPQFKPIGKVEREEVKQINLRIKDLFTSRIGGVIYDSADTIVISAFLGLTTLAIYQNYFYILNAITGFITVILNACTAGIGNSIVAETKNKNYEDLNKFTFIICWISGFCATCLFCLYQPFMECWVGEELMLDLSAVICFTAYFFIRQINALLNLYKDASGMWHEDRFRPLAASLVNLFLNLILVQTIGIYGVILSTVLAIICVGGPWLLHNLFTVIFDRRYLLPYLKRLLINCVYVILSGALTYLICSLTDLPLMLTLLARGIICCIVPNVLFYFAYRKRKEFYESVILADKVTKGRFDLERMIR